MEAALPARSKPKPERAPAPPDEILETYRALLAERQRAAIGGTLEVTDYTAILRLTAARCGCSSAQAGDLVMKARAEGLA